MPPVLLANLLWGGSVCDGFMSFKTEGEIVLDNAGESYPKS